MMLLGSVLLIVGVYLAIRMARGNGPARPAGAVETPLDILKKRYARGEISKEEYEERRKVLL